MKNKNKKDITNYTHPPPAPPPEEAPDPRPGNYYVSVRDGKRTGLLLGPYKTHAEALKWVDAGRKIACNGNDFAHFYSYGTVRMPDDFTTPGTLNPRLEKLMDFARDIAREEIAKEKANDTKD